MAEDVEARERDEASGLDEFREEVRARYPEGDAGDAEEGAEDVGGQPSEGEEKGEGDPELEEFRGGVVKRYPEVEQG